MYCGDQDSSSDEMISSYPTSQLRSGAVGEALLCRMGQKCEGWDISLRLHHWMVRVVAVTLFSVYLFNMCCATFR